MLRTFHYSSLIAVVIISIRSFRYDRRSVRFDTIEILSIRYSARVCVRNVIKLN